MVALAVYVLLAIRNEVNMTLDEINQLETVQARQAFASCCSSESWINGIADARPFLNHDAMHQMALDIWNDLTEADYLQAFEGHPKIGDVNSLRKKYASTKGLASNEQSGVNSANEKTLLDLSRANDVYFEKNGFIFIVYATGKSAVQMLEILNQRLANDRTTEIQNAAIEQSKITALRLDKLLGLVK
ncbi:MAG: 2-oxo-4-hydroxy-4-carboxy-5-ureidoimidazoline decarboxylase [Oceanicoccus sp.]|jgi:2-oxo-4-hydroxy-4-carboxy-5-ureidoimidazoline decarboxylase